ncbi:MAG: GNAT family N-acetyltransferase/peptidase C39 family protein [Bdellovibrionaceae bacterium]|nr:GNAT family N-acetyltransferase/peptidase C39 family protein [Bdellovibrionales bacterium]MCB9084288.1 GNAT family N-acetyltransferase/peptidase C39 family protein [Pseudobdellovibrionaceae bacterium]
MKLNFRQARLGDLTSLIEIESLCFKSDRLSRASFRHFIKSDKSDLFVALSHDHSIVGYFLIFYRRGTTLARLYSIAVHPRYRGKGLGGLILEEAENAARERKKSWFRLEVRPDNKRAIKLYKTRGYRKFRVTPAFYEDRTEAHCYEKRLLPLQLGTTTKVPYYHQNTEFTCGPASLLMAMSALSKKIKPCLEEEMAIWREATTVFMTSGHGGCGPRGLALAAHRRGFKSEVWVSHANPLFLDGVRSEKKKKVIEAVYQVFEKQISKSRIPIRCQRLSISDLEKALRNNRIPLVLISSYKLVRSKSPHWVVLAGFDEDHFYVHDPELELEIEPHPHPETSPAWLNVAFMPVKKSEFIKMARYGKSKIESAVFVSKKGR